MPSEAQARITINKLLEEASLRFLPDQQERRENIVYEHRAKLQGIRTPRRTQYRFRKRSQWL